MVFAHPERLVPLAATAAVVLTAGVLAARRRRPPLVVLLSVALRAGLCAGLVFLLLGPRRVEVARQPGPLLVALDLSRSVSPAARAEAWAWLGRVAPEAGPVRCVGFGEEARLLAGDRAGLDAAPPAGGELASDPHPALARLLLGGAARGGAGRLLLLSDGALPPPDPGIGRASGLEPLVLPIDSLRAAGFRATGLAPEEVPAVHRPLRLSFTGTASAPGEGTLELYQDGRLVRRRPVVLEGGELALTCALPEPEPGSHLVAARLLLEGDEPLDNAAACAFDVAAPPRALVVSADEEPLVGAALRAQGIETGEVRPGRLLETPGELLEEERPSVLVLDRVATSELSAAAVLAAVGRHVERGGGLLHLPRTAPGELFGTAERPFLGLLPLIGRVPPPPPAPEEEPEEEPGEGLAPPDPEKRKSERREAPTLGLLLVVDASRSMKGQKLALAKEAAIAAAEVLHPEDHVGVIAFNEHARVVLQMTPARDQEFIADRISRIRSEGGTHFGRALEEAQDVLAWEPFAIKHVVLLSDGESRPAPLKKLVSSMVGSGITVSTVGCGYGFNEQVLSDIAVWGRGRFLPAFSPQEIPQVFTIEAERVIEAHGARSRGDAAPEPEEGSPETAGQAEEEEPPEERGEPEAPPARPLRLGLPAPYTQGIAPHLVPGLLGLHETDARRGAWVSLELDDGLPVAAHRHHGDGRVLAFATPLEGPWAAHLAGWEDYHVLLAQAVRFLHQTPAEGRFHLSATARGRSVVVTVHDREERDLPARQLAWRVRDEAGREPEVAVERVSGERWRFTLAPTEPSAALAVTVLLEGQEAGGPAHAAVAPPPEVRTAGLDLAGLEAWAQALGGTVRVGRPEPLGVPGGEARRSEAAGQEVLPLLLALLLLDLLLKRARPGTFR